MRTFLTTLMVLGIAPALSHGQLPSITSQPLNRTVWQGVNVVFSVGVSGGPFSYQWQFNATNLPDGIITTFAGGGVGDDGAATNASLYNPWGVAVDTAGNLFIADQNNERIRRVSTNGIITTVAGNGRYGFSGDGGAAVSASLRHPQGVAVDAAGNLYIASFEDNRIRKVDNRGIITTVAGNGTADYSGDGGAATNASLHEPYGVAIDAVGNLFIADTINDRIRKVDTNGIITTVAGGGTNSPGDGTAATNVALAFTSALALDAAGDLFIADGTRIHKVNTNGIITTFAGGGTNYPGDGTAATNASFSSSYGLAVDAAGNLFISDFYNQRVIRKVDTNGIIKIVAGNGTYGYSGDGGAATNARLFDPSGLAVDAAGNLFIADVYNNRIRKVGTNGIITTAAGDGPSTSGEGLRQFSGDGGAATNASLSDPSSMAMDTAGNLFIADMDNNRVRKVDTNGTITTVAGNGVYGFFGDGNAATNASLTYPFGLAADSAGNVFIADYNNQRIRKVAANGIIRTIAGNGTNGYSGDGGPATNASLSNPSGLAVDAVGNLFVADSGNNRLRKVDHNGVITTVAGNGAAGYSGDGGAATSASLAGPSGVALDAAGNLFIADENNNVVRKVGVNGIITTFAGAGTNYPGDGGAATNAGTTAYSVAIDANGNLFIADTGNERIRRVDTNGIITTVAGNGAYGYSGDGGLATNASLAFPISVAVDAFGCVYIADQYDNHVRKVMNTRGPRLVLNNVGTNNAGNYQVSVTGPGGSVTTSNATLTIATAPLIYRTASQPDGSMALCFVSPPGSTNMVLCATNLAAPISWQPLSTNVAGTDGDWQFTDTNAAGSATRYYRSVKP